jgi:hypothetical protein
MSMDQGPTGGPAEIVVATDYRLDPPLDGRDPAELLRAEQGLTLDLGDGRRVLLDPGDERAAGFARVVDGLRDQGRPIAVELSQTGGVGRLFAPHVTPVVSVRPTDGGVEVQLAASHARHTLRQDVPGYDELRRTLEDAAGTRRMLVVTEDVRDGILDVRPIDIDDAPPYDFERPLPKTFLERIRFWWHWFVHWLTCCCWFPFSIFRGISPTRAQQVFDAMAAGTCNPATVPPPCIPFLYPYDGCWGRAHEMCRLMRLDGLRPCKVWIQGGLRVDTANSINCFVQWGWHVAPTLCVRGTGCLGWFIVRSMVFDPSLFTTPVTKAQWKGVQGDANATLTDSSWSIFHLWSATTNPSWFTKTDPGFVQTNSVLAYYRTALQLQTVNYGPPPFPCP